MMRLACKLLPALMVVYAAPCFANLGDTPQEIESRYGQPIERLPDQTTARTFANTYRRPSFPNETITVTFLDRISQYEFYQKNVPAIAYRNYGHFSDEEVAPILEANAHNQIWYRLKDDETEIVAWRLGSEDADTATAVASRQQRWQNLTVQTSVYLRWTQKAAVALAARPTTTASSSPARPVTARMAGDLMVARGKFPVAASEAVYDRMDFYLNNGDAAALMQLHQAGLITILKPGTRVRIIESRGLFAETKDKIQIVGTAFEVWVRPTELFRESDATVPTAKGESQRAGAHNP